MTIELLVVLIAIVAILGIICFLTLKDLRSDIYSIQQMFNQKLYSDLTVEEELAKFADKLDQVSKTMSAPQSPVPSVNKTRKRWKDFSERQKAQIKKAYENSETTGETPEQIVSRLNATFNLNHGFKAYQKVWSD